MKSNIYDHAREIILQIRIKILILKNILKDKLLKKVKDLNRRMQSALKAFFFYLKSFASFPVNKKILYRKGLDFLKGPLAYFQVTLYAKMLYNAIFTTL